jgi:hypothetical protein
MTGSKAGRQFLISTASGEITESLVIKYLDYSVQTFLTGGGPHEN